ncbi:MAG TPA: hypothetical protein VHB99_11830, partial [Pirellulales bacterium]|nr:hypothetical protein [Pirellulales bacterium]
MKRMATFAATLVVLAAAIYFGRSRPEPAAAPAASPADCIERMFAAAERGDVEAYLACFTGAELRRLSAERDAEPLERFAAALVESVRPLKGRAINGPSHAPGSERAKLEIERIYEHHGERQSYAFRREADGWRIDSIGPVER